ncbi:uncharacterized protein K444DRAFT_629118 [Hyaloscypha bicolor E]|uniref:F-box domain-containing protein n=1 Tax=Hyaloscypha bicolor E TaxID=1095630 RepID=A0A2J6TC63_9HELO|nr:uncharacterized protein K444DRAFT_629118 [Hyaloscypha bicolor E]PMD60620.1 hypothetical protein K444DRAFT_629118 [Hyaloscypha bicolor E]
MEEDEFRCWSGGRIEEQAKRPVAWMNYELMQHLLRYWRNEENMLFMSILLAPAMTLARLHPLLVTSSSITTLNQPLTLTNLPADIHFAIFKNLHIVHATCLGLTNTTFYAVLKAIYPGKISIDPYAYKYSWAKVGLLGNLISQWMRPRMLWDGFVFVTPERYKELEDRDYDLSLQAQFEEMCKW